MSVNKSTNLTIDEKKVMPAPGTCTTCNIVHLILCKQCNKPYVGKSSHMLRIRFEEHRRTYYKVISGEKVDVDDDLNCVGLHLYTEHGLRERVDFNRDVSVCILKNASPSS
jgi:hypothetical protein